MDGFIPRPFNDDRPRHHFGAWCLLGRWRISCMGGQCCDQTRWMGQLGSLSLHSQYDFGHFLWTGENHHFDWIFKMDGSFNGILISSLCCGVQFSPLIKLKFSVIALPDLFLKPDGKPKRLILMVLINGRLFTVLLNFQGFNIVSSRDMVGSRNSHRSRSRSLCQLLVLRSNGYQNREKRRTRHTFCAWASGGFPRCTWNLHR